MKIGIIVQARMSSQRLPDKVLTKVNGKPLLQYLLERLNNCSSIDQVIVATSNEKSDDSIALFCEEYGAKYFRGPLENVAKRFMMVIEEYNLDAFVRICGDSPILDQQLIDRGVKLFNSGFDLVTNVWPRSYPLGQSVEIVRSDTFKEIFKKMSKISDFEHVTKYFYDHSDKFKIKNFSNDINLSDYSLVVDTPHDLKHIEKIINCMTRTQTKYSLEDILEIYPLARKALC
jgi:spore coat polysaccharide biosynthesis protein SpsF